MQTLTHTLPCGDYSVVVCVRVPVPAPLPACLRLPTSLPAFLPAFLPASLPAFLFSVLGIEYVLAAPPSLGE